MTKTRIEKLTAEELDILLNAFHAPSFMKANIKAGGEWIIANFNMTIKMLDGEFVAIIEEA